MGVDKINKEDLEKYVKESTNWKDLMKKCGYTNFNNRNPLKKRIKLYNLSISHFTNKSTSKRYTDEEIFCKDSKYQSSEGIKKRLIETYNILYKCNKCGINEWLGLILQLELDHINGDHYDNRLENLRLLCPNCHSQTDTFRGKNVKISDETIQNNTCKCGNNKCRTSAICFICRENKKKTKTNITINDNIYHYTNNKQCLDCNKIIQNVSTRCIDCFKKNRKNNSILKEKGKRVYKKCIDCNKNIKTSISDKCKECIDKTIIKKKCNECDKVLKNIKLDKCFKCISSNKDKSHNRKKCIKCNKVIRSNINNTCRNCNTNNKKCISCSHIINSKKSDKCLQCRNIIKKDKVVNNIIQDVINDMITTIENTLENTIIIPTETQTETQQEHTTNTNLTKQCIECNENIWSNATRCVSCSRVNSRKVARPSYEQILEDKKTMSMVAIGKKYNVSDNAIRKWIRQYES